MNNNAFGMFSLKCHTYRFFTDREKNNNNYVTNT